MCVLGLVNGALHLHNGLRADAQTLARKNLAAFDGTGYDTIIVNAAGCGAALKAYPELLRGTAEEAERLAPLLAAAQVLTGDRASEEALKAAMESRSRLV